MDLNKEIRETIAFYCGGTYENRKLATDKILQICKDKPLPIHGVAVSDADIYLASADEEVDLLDARGFRQGAKWCRRQY